MTCVASTVTDFSFFLSFLQGVVLKLLEAGSAPDIKDSVKDGNTPLDVAKTTRIANILLDALSKPAAPQQTAAAAAALEVISWPARILAAINDISIYIRQPPDPPWPIYPFAGKRRGKQQRGRPHR